MQDAVDKLRKMADEYFELARQNEQDGYQSMADRRYAKGCAMLQAAGIVIETSREVK